MGSWFSASQAGQGSNLITDHDRAILDLKAQRDRLELYVKKLDAVREKEAAAAKKLLREGKRSQAQLCLKKRKFQEVLINRSEQMYLNLQQLVESVEFATVQSAVFDQLKKGANVLKAIQAEMSVDAVEELMADTQEALEYQKEVDSLLSRNLSAEDEQDVLDELESLSTEVSEADFVSKPQKQPVSVKEPLKEPIASPEPLSPVVEDQSAISDADLRELEELEEIMHIPSAPKHAVNPSITASTSSKAVNREQRQLVAE